jgi:diacylglycerol kinase (ATP)
LKYYIIVNPIAGRGFAEIAIPQIEAGFQKHDLQYDLVRTERPWHAADLAEQAGRDGYDVVVTASGDGTANECLNGLMRLGRASKSKPAFSILPVGTGNDMAYGLGMRGNLDESIAALAKNYRQRIDVGIVKGGDYPDGRYFANGVGIGFDAAVGFVAVKIRWARGLLAYLIAVIQTIFIYYKAPTVEITYNNISYTQPALMVSVMNGQRMGGGFYMAPQSELDDGHFDLCIAANPKRARIFGLIPYFLKGTQASQPEITTGRTDRIKVVARQGSLPAHCDGETLCEAGSALTVQILPGALDFVTMEFSRQVNQ